MKSKLKGMLSLLLCMALICACVPRIYADETKVSTEAATEAASKAEKKVEFYPTSELLKIKSHIEKDAGMDKYATVQGACSDGRYAYFAVQDASTVILKYDTKNWKLVKKAKVSDLGHANDMAYNSKENIIAVANNYSSGDKLTMLDPKTLKVKSTVVPQLKKNQIEIDRELKERKKSGEKNIVIKPYKDAKIYAIAYNAEKDCYIVGFSGTKYFGLMNSNYKINKRFKGVGTGYMHQGCDCDENYIYFAQSGGDNTVVIYDYNGKKVDMISLGHTHEVENLFHIGKNFYTTLHYYGNSVHRVGLSDALPISFRVHYDPGTAEGTMKDTVVHYGKTTRLRKCTFEMPGYFFGGWLMSRTSDDRQMGYTLGSKDHEWLSAKNLYNSYLVKDEGKVSKLVKYGDVRLTAFWISKRYEIRYTADADEGYMLPESTAYREKYIMPENEFVKNGYIFVGYYASRNYDGRVYGYRADSEEAEWLESGDAVKMHMFKPGDAVKELTYGGTVTMTAQFRTAYTFSDDKSELLSYIGIDERVEIPDNDGRLKMISTGAFRGNSVMTRMIVPSSVNEIQSGAMEDCSELREIVFTGSFPEKFDDNCIVGGSKPTVYQDIGGDTVFLGYTFDRNYIQMMRYEAEVLALRQK